MQPKSQAIIITSAAFLLACAARSQDSDAPAKKADNTERNATDRSNTTTADVRKDIMAAKNMSVDGEIADKYARHENVDNQLEPNAS